MACTWHAHGMHMACPWHAHGMHTTARTACTLHTHTPHVLHVRCMLTAYTLQAADLATAIASADGKVTKAGVNDMLSRERDRTPKAVPPQSKPRLPRPGRQLRSPGRERLVWPAGKVRQTVVSATPRGLCPRLGDIGEIGESPQRARLGAALDLTTPQAAACNSPRARAYPLPIPLLRFGIESGIDTFEDLTCSGDQQEIKLADLVEVRK